MNVPAKEWPWPTAPMLPKREVDPIVLQIVEGTLNSIEAEIEYAIERTARSPMIREAHDYRVGLFDRYCRKLTGRSYSAMPNAVLRDFPPQTMQPGDGPQQVCEAINASANIVGNFKTETEGQTVVVVYGADVRLNKVPDGIKLKIEKF